MGVLFNLKQIILLGDLFFFILLKRKPRSVKLRR